MSLEVGLNDEGRSHLAFEGDFMPRSESGHLTRRPLLPRRTLPRCPQNPGPPPSILSHLMQQRSDRDKLHLSISRHARTRPYLTAKSLCRALDVRKLFLDAKLNWSRMRV